MYKPLIYENRICNSHLSCNLENDSLNLNLKECSLFCDNQTAISCSNSPIENQKTKHIHIKYLFLRNQVYDKIFKLKYITRLRVISLTLTKTGTLKINGTYSFSNGEEKWRCRSKSFGSCLLYDIK